MTKQLTLPPLVKVDRARPSPIREVLESDESDVIYCWALDFWRAPGRGSLNTALRRTALAFVTRAI